MDTLSNFIFSIREWWANDPKAKLKALFVVLTLIFVLILGYGIYYINFVAPNNNFAYNITDNNSKVNLKNFENAARLEAVNSSDIGNAHKFLFNKDHTVTFDSQARLNLNFKSIENSPNFFPTSIFDYKDNLIINEPSKTTIYNYSKKSFSVLEKIISVVPIPNSTDFRYLKFENGNIKVYSMANLNSDLNQSTYLSSFVPVVNPQLVQQIVLNNRIYILAWSNINSSGTLEIWQSNRTEAKQLQSISDVNTFSSGPNDLLYTSSDNKTISLVSFVNNSNGTKNNLRVDETLSKNKINGAFSANRCNIDSKEILTCLVKKQAVRYTDYTEIDSIVQFSPNVTDLKVLYEGLNISGSNIFIVDSKYNIIGQEKGLLYKIKS